jgi:hypothetical protein
MDANERDEGMEDWETVTLYGGAIRLRVPSGWQRRSRDDGGLACQRGGMRPADLLAGAILYHDPRGATAADAMQYLDREHRLPQAACEMIAADSKSDADRLWLAYAMEQPLRGPIFVWRVAQIYPPSHVCVLTLQLHIGENEGERRADAEDEEEDDEALAAALHRELMSLVLPASLEEARARSGQGGIPLQEISLRNHIHDGRLRFRLPWDWQTVEGDRGLFERKDEADATQDHCLRVVSQAFPRHGPDANLRAREALKEAARSFSLGPDHAQGEGSVDPMPDGEAFARFQCLEAATGFSWHLWLRGWTIDGMMHVALFSLRSPLSKAAHPDLKIVNRIERCIVEARLVLDEEEQEEIDKASVPASPDGGPDFADILDFIDRTSVAAEYLAPQDDDEEADSDEAANDTHSIGNA